MYNNKSITLNAVPLLFAAARDFAIAARVTFETVAKPKMSESFEIDNTTFVTKTSI